MSAVKRHRFLLLIVVFTYDHCVCTPDYSPPKFRLGNGTVLKDNADINIMYGNPLELFCTGQDDNLRVASQDTYTWQWVRVPHTSINETTIKVFVEKPERQYLYYSCEDENCDDSCHNNNQLTRITVTIDSLPAVTDFHCIISDSARYFNCSWASVNVRPHFKLYYLKGGVSFLACSVSFLMPKFCIINSQHVINEETELLSLLMNTCNVWGCKNQTLEFYVLNVLKVDPPADLQLVRHTSRSAVLQWRTSQLFSYILSAYQNYKFTNFKITVAYSGTKVLPAFNVALPPQENNRYEYTLQLPCPDTYYEVKVFCINPFAVEDDQRYWSGTSVSFSTDDESDSASPAPDPTCIHRSVKLTPDVMLSEIHNFKRKMKQELKTLKEMTDALKLKFANLSPAPNTP